jgi:hypothetical protein
MIDKTVFWVVMTCGLIGFSVVTFADTEVYSVSKWGNIQYDRPHYIAKDTGEIREVSKWGNETERSYQERDDKVYEVSKWGNIDYSKPSFIRK